MAAHVRLKNELTEDEKCNNLMGWLICFSLNYGKIPTLSVALEHAQLQDQLGREFIHRQGRKKILDEYRLELRLEYYKP